MSAADRIERAAAATAHTIAAIDWPAWSFAFLIAFAVAYLFRLDRQPTTFRLYQFIADRDGTANSASLTYTGIFLVGTWLVWYLAIHEQWGEAVALVGSLGGIFVVGGVARQYVGSRERIATMGHAPVQTEQTTSIRTTVTGGAPESPPEHLP